MSQTQQLQTAAEEAFLAGRFEGVETICQQILEIDPEHVQSLHLLRINANRNSDIHLELDLLNRILAIAPDHVESLNGLGDALRKQGQFAEAIKACERAIALRPNYANAHNTLGLCLSETGKIWEATKCFETAIYLHPKLAAAHLNLGSCLRKLNRDVEAVRCYRRAISLAPNSSEAYEALGLLLFQQHRRKEATECYRRVLELNPRSVRAHLLLADSLEKLGSPAEAISIIQNALALNPDSAPGHCMLGFAMLDLGEFKKATEAFERSITLEPRTGGAYVGIVTSKKITGADAQLLDQMIDVLKAPGLSAEDQVQIHAAIGKAFDDLGRYEEAISYADQGNLIALTLEDEASRPTSKGAADAHVQKSIEIFTPEFLRSRKSMSIETDLPTFIVGLPRSGTTLMEQIVSSHSRVAAGGEITYWDDVGCASAGGLIGLAFNPARATAAAMDYLRLLEAIGPKALRVTDKYNDNTMNLGFLHLMFPNARIIHCMRNPLDNCISMYMTPFRKKPAHFCTREDILAYCKRYQKLMGHWRKILPKDRLLEVNYEDVIADRETVARRVIEFCGLEWEDSCLRHEDNDRVVITPSKWQARQPIYKSSVERWRRYEPWLGAFRELIPQE